MKHLVAFLLVLLSVSSAWSNPTTRVAVAHVDQVAHLQHQEAALPTALVQDQRDLVDIRLSVPPEADPGIEAPSSVDAHHLAILVDQDRRALEAPATVIQASVEQIPLSGFRHPIETPGPIDRDALTRHRCCGVTASAFTTHAAIHTGA